MIEQHGAANTGEESGRIQAVRVRRVAEVSATDVSKSESAEFREDVQATAVDGAARESSSTVPLSQLFAKKAGEWVCNVCMVTNKESSSKVGFSSSLCTHACLLAYACMFACVCMHVCLPEEFHAPCA